MFPRGGILSLAVFLFHFTSFYFTSFILLHSIPFRFLPFLPLFDRKQKYKHCSRQSLTSSNALNHGTRQIVYYPQNHRIPAIMNWMLRKGNGYSIICVCNREYVFALMYVYVYIRMNILFCQQINVYHCSWRLSVNYR